MADVDFPTIAPRLLLALAVWIAALALATPTAPRAEDPPILSCPHKVVMPRAGAVAPPDWRLYWNDSMDTELDDVTIVSGSSLQSHLSVLRPTTHYENLNAAWDKQKIEKIWRLPPVRNRQPFWIFCDYQLSATRLFRRLPEPVRSCQLTAQYLGNPYPGTPMTMQCR